MQRFCHPMSTIGLEQMCKASLTNRNLRFACANGKRHIDVVFAYEKHRENVLKTITQHEHIQMCIERI